MKLFIYPEPASLPCQVIVTPDDTGVPLVAIPDTYTGPNGTRDGYSVELPATVQHRHGGWLSWDWGPNYVAFTGRGKFILDDPTDPLFALDSVYAVKKTAMLPRLIVNDKFIAHADA